MFYFRCPRIKMHRINDVLRHHCSPPPELNARVSTFANTAALNRENYRYTCQHVCNVCRMRPVICLIQRLYVRLHGSKVRVDRRTLLRVLHYSFQNASSAQCRTPLKRLAGRYRHVTYIALL